MPDGLTGEAVVANGILESGADEDTSLREELSQHIGTYLGKPIRPRESLFTSACPEPLSGKIVPQAIPEAYTGADIGDASSIENPGTMEQLRDW